jgi:hypothetical protein
MPHFKDFTLAFISFLPSTQRNSIESAKNGENSCYKHKKDIFGASIEVVKLKKSAYIDLFRPPLQLRAQ